MKHLIALSMKYIRRQRLRTFLTFMCITLSAFILTTICTFGSSLYTTAYNYARDEDGLWEVDISSWIAHSKDKVKALDMVANHAVVDDYIFINNNKAGFPSEDALNKSYFEAADGKNTFRFTELQTKKVSGNTALIGKYDKEEYLPSYKVDTTKEGVYLPAVFRDKGYSEGDTITLTVRPTHAVLDENSEEVKKAREYLKEKYGTEYCKGEAGYEKLPEETRKKAYKGSIYNILYYNFHLTIDDMPFTNNEYGEPVTYTMKIAGFLPQKSYAAANSNSLTIQNTDSTNIDLSELSAKNPEIDLDEENSSYSVRIRLIDNCDYDEALKMLFTDLGFDYDRNYNDAQSYPHIENTTLLALEVKSPYAMYQFLLAAVIPILIVLLIGWFIARFVIDNTFEMAVQERSTHFAAMRIMGASKTQVAFVVLIEAIFYCLTAVPMGIILAVLICKFSFNSLTRSGLELFEFSAKPLFILVAALLTIIAIFISAYTSAMWASRKLSPAEALNFGKPRSKKRRFRKGKSKLNLSSKKFLRRYTRKNIKTAKSRFIVSTITMALGVLMFTITTLIGSYIYTDIKKALRSEDFYDFMIDGYVSAEPDPIAELDNYFSNKEVFSDYIIRGQRNINLNTMDGSNDIVNDKLARTKKAKSTISWLYAIPEELYKRYELDTLTGMSYEEFRNSGGAIYSNSMYGEMPTFDEETREPIALYDKGYTDLKKGYKITDMLGCEYQIKGIVTCSLELDRAIILPVEKAADYYATYDIGLNVADTAHYSEALKRVNELKENTTDAYIWNNFAYHTGLSTFLGALLKIIATFLASIWLVGILSMVNSVNTSVLNRSRELMMLRSVGMTRKQLRKSVFLETIMFSATAAIMGTLVGIGGFMLFLWSSLSLKNLFAVPTVALLSLTVNIIISLLAAIPAIKSLGKVESIAQAANG